jgi:DNA topoisomerase-2
LEDYNEELAVDHTRDEITYKEFVDQEMIHFSVYNNMRSICHLIDGLKPSKRKIMFGFFKKNVKKEVKVAQISGYIAEHSAYHHGEMSLQKTIVNLAQNFVGSNNINLLEPIGQFGTRLMGGADHASARYIHTRLSPIARKLFVEHDDHLLDYNIDDGTLVEPKFYVPILPYILINGSIGIGTGYSSTIPSYKVTDICRQIQDRLNGKEDFEDMVPWYNGFDGEIIKNEDKGYISRGIFELDRENNILSITELPIKTWTRKYKDMLEKMIKDDVNIEDFTEHHTVKKVHFQIVLKPATTAKLQTDEKIIKMFKLENTVSTTNMMLFNGEGKMRKYSNIQEILREFYQFRLEYYKKRKVYLLSLLDKELQVLENKIRFIQSVMNEEIIIKRQKAKKIVNQLIRKNFKTTEELPQIQSAKVKALDKRKGVIKETQETEESEEEEVSDGKFFFYLI